MHESGPGLYAQVRWCRWTFRSCWTFGTVYKGNTGRLLQWLHHAPCSFSWVSCSWNQSKALPRSPKETLVSSHLDALCFSPYQQLNDIPYPSLPLLLSKICSVSSQQAGRRRAHFLWLAATTAPAERSQDGCRQQMAPTYEPAPPPFHNLSWT